jgi:hypothetical protein
MVSQARRPCSGSSSSCSSRITCMDDAHGCASPVEWLCPNNLAPSNSSSTPCTAAARAVARLSLCGCGWICYAFTRNGFVPNKW